MPPKADLRSRAKARSVERDGPRAPPRRLREPASAPSNGLLQAGSTRVFSAVAVCSLAGRSEGKPKTNQDAYFVDTDLHGDPELPLLAVFDGHGLCGHKVAQFLAFNLKGSRDSF
jgi:hypothetical protein